MGSIILRDFALNIILLPDETWKRRGKHQKQIIKLQALIRELAETGSVEKARELAAVPPIKCRDDTTLVDHCRYLQYCVSWLKNYLETEPMFQKNEGA